MHHRSLRCSSVFLFVLATGCGGGDFVSGKGGKGGKGGAVGDGDASSGAVSGSGGAESGTGGSSSSSGGRSASGGSATSGGTSSDGGRHGVPDASAGGTDAGGGATGAGGGATDAGGGGSSGAAGAGGSGAGGGTSSGGAGGSPDCTNPTTWYRDDDQDGYGSTATPPIVSCIPPPGHFAKVGNDCNDSNDMVHPQLTPPELQYFSKPYQSPAGVDSYDYDCSGHEEGDPSQAKAAAMCPAASLGSCGGSGYLAVSTGSRIAANGYCGSKSYRTCVNQLAALCSAQDVTNYSVAYRCK